MAVFLCLALVVAVAGGCRHEAPVEPEKQIAEGWKWYRSGDFSLAIKAFESALTAAPTNGILRQQALYGLASTWALRRPDEDPQRAMAYHREVMAADPKGDLAGWSALALARLRTMPVAGESVELKEHLKAYQEVIDSFPHHTAGEEAFLFLQAARLSDPQAGQEQAVLEALEAYVKAHPESPWRGTCFRLIAHCCDVLDRKERRFEATVEEWKAKEAMAPTNALPDRSFTYWRLATLAEFTLGDFDLAREYYGKLIADYPTEQRVFLAKQELKRMEALEKTLRAETGPAGETTR